MSVEFSSPIADSRDYPPASIRVTPSVFRPGTASVRPVPVNATDVLALTRARTGIYLVARSIGRGANVWVPAYHCPALVEPLIAAGLGVSFYPVTPDLQPDLDYLAKHHAAIDPVVGIRYFGFETGLPALGDFCRGRGSVLIEDLAHAPFVEELIGDVAVTSLYKFYPSTTGAELLLTSSMPARERLIEQYQCLPDLWAEGARSLISRGKKRLGFSTDASRFRYFRFDEVSRHVDRHSRKVLCTSDHREIVSARRHNFRYLLNRLAGVDSGRPLFPEPDDGVTPYVFPFLLDDDKDFGRIRRQGVQAYRWEELASGPCPVSNDYRRRLIQLPVHQDLARDDLDFMSSLLSGGADEG